MELKIGLKGKQHIMVEKENTAAMVGSGMLPVFSTPSMIAMMESAAMNSVALCLGETESTVGGGIAVRHTSPTPVGMVVYCESELIGIDGRKLTFSVKAYDECGPTGEGTHERFIVDAARFTEKAEKKKSALLS